MGITDFDDNMSTRLLPGEKPRKKDVGTTSYKKPGPPTPSKNGGRVSLQNNEIVHQKDILKEHNESKTPKRSTPKFIGRLLGKNVNTKENIEVGSESENGWIYCKMISSNINSFKCATKYFICNCGYYTKYVCTCKSEPDFPPHYRKFRYSEYCFETLKRLFLFWTMIIIAVYIKYWFAFK